MAGILTRPLQALVTYVTALTVGSICGLFVQYHYRYTGLLQIPGYDRYLTEIKQGRLIIASNHPSLVEPMLLLGMCWPHVLWRPLTFFPFSMPDNRQFRGYEWLYWCSHSIPVSRDPDRSKAINDSAKAKAKAVLTKDLTLIVHPEGGCTDSLHKDGSRPEMVTAEVRGQTRTIREIRGNLPELAIQTGARILPVFGGVAFISEIPQPYNRLFAVLKYWMRHRMVVTIQVGESYHPDKKDRRLNSIKNWNKGCFTHKRHNCRFFIY